MYLDQGRGLKSDNWANIQRIHLSSLGKKIWMDRCFSEEGDTIPRSLLILPQIKIHPKPYFWLLI